MTQKENDKDQLAAGGWVRFRRQLEVEGKSKQDLELAERAFIEGMRAAGTMQLS